MRNEQHLHDIAARRFARMEFQGLLDRIQRDVVEGIKEAAVLRWERLLQGPPKPDAALMYPRFSLMPLDELEELRRTAWFKAKNRARECARTEAMMTWRG